MTPLPRWPHSIRPPARGFAQIASKARASGFRRQGHKVCLIHFKGEFLLCRGPLNIVPSSQGRPALIRSGRSPRYGQLRAKHAASIIATANGVADGDRSRLIDRYV
jgi:alkanesulfonate monooxygenase SsuD/methylene tetrahydromethanopterin reductase-like flavin-dependent oxidoreductase (luciferase family)